MAISPLGSKGYILKELLAFGTAAVAGAVEAMGTDLALWHTDGFDKILKLGKLQCAQP